MTTNKLLELFLLRDPSSDKGTFSSKMIRVIRFYNVASKGGQPYNMFIPQKRRRY